MTAYTYHPQFRLLLAAVLAAPGDDLPRVVMADWLEENGQPERAEFIRVQVELEKMVSVDPKCPNIIPRPGIHYNTFGSVKCDRCWPHRNALRRRERELFGGNCRSWFPVPGYSECEWCTPTSDHSNHSPVKVIVRRGFVAEVRCTLADWCGGVCGRCRGVGGQSFVARGGLNTLTRLFVPGRERADCRPCSGTGHMPGIGPRLVREHPVQRVGVTDREPLQDEHGMGWSWWRENAPGERGYNYDAELPVAVYEILPGWLIYTTAAGAKFFPTPAAATDALSTACLSWAKSQTPAEVPA